jgi:ribosomal protein S1
MRLHPVGTRSEGVVVEVWSFGLVVELGSLGPVGFLGYPDAGPGGTAVAPGAEAVPSVGDLIQVEVVAHQPERRQLSLRRG